MIFHVSEAAAGDRTIFTPSSGRRFRVVGYHLVAAGAVAVTWKRATTAFGGAWTFAAGTPQTALPNGLDRVGLMEGDTEQALILNLSLAVQVSGWIDVDHL